MAGINLDHCKIVANEKRAGWVDQAVLDLAGFVCGNIERQPRMQGPIVLVGRQAVLATSVQHPGLRALELDGLSDQGFILETVRCRAADFIVCCGGGSRGDANAVIELVKSINSTDDGCTVEEMHRREEPFFAVRGMYAHQHWAYNYPYSLRTWRFDDWRAYIDLLAYLRINLFQIWSMAGILPDPLSDGDRAYLENYHRVIDYAKNRRGMEVYIGECANNVAEHDGGKPVAQRDYFEVEVLKNPGNPIELDQIMANRRNFYFVASNADGYWIIDSDPGGWEGSPVSEFVDILAANRRLIDECTDLRTDAKLVYWMWYGWAKGTPLPQRMEACREVVEQVSERLSEPWTLLACNETHLQQVRSLRCEGRTIFFPYNYIEREPSQPFTRLRFEELRQQLGLAASANVFRGVLGNAQTPFVQLPNIFFFAEAAWHGPPASDASTPDTVARLARLLVGDYAEALAEGWLLLESQNLDRVVAAARRLASLVRNVGDLPGPLGLLYAPGLGRLFADLAIQLRIHAGALRLIHALEQADPQDRIETLIDEYACRWFRWQRIHGFSRQTRPAPDWEAIAGLYSTHCERPEYTSQLRAKLISKGIHEQAIEAFLTMFAKDN